MAGKQWLNRLSFIYLSAPFVIFCLGWLWLPVGLAATAVFAWLAWRNRKRERILPIFGDPVAEYGQKKILPAFSQRALWIGIAILGVWVLLSGIGGYAFQNRDFHVRNAILQDLVNHDWPVLYPGLGLNGGAGMLVYYIGDWLPAALVGKVLGLGAANTGLFLWTWLGVTLAALHIRQRLAKSSLIWAATLLIFFSGMDAVGVIFMRQVLPGGYPALWPPIQHLEWWAPNMQFSSFTTQLFWVFNQTVPAWLCLGLLLNASSKRTMFLAWSLCFFYAPLPAVGMMPLAGLALLQTSAAASWRERLRGFFRDLRPAISVENVLGGGVVLVLSALYFTLNRASGAFAIFGPDQVALPIALIFFLLEGGTLWLLLLPEHRHDARWYVVGVTLLVAPFITLGYSTDFGMRVSIPGLFYLMIWAGESLAHHRRRMRGLAIMLCLAIGALTPLYEIDRSLYRTVSYDVQALTGSLPPSGNQMGSPAETVAPFIPETVHPGALTADYLPSMAVFDPKWSINFITDPTASIFYRYGMRHPPD